MARWLLLVVVCALAGAAHAADIEFNRDVRPILSDRCYACHGPDKGNRKTKMRLDVEADAKADLGKGRFGIVEGKPESSEIYKRIVSTSKAQRMPPAYLGHDALTPKDATVIKTWIEQGAHYQPHWSFIPPVRPAPPAVTDSAWVRNPIDGFILSRLTKEGLKPSPEADRRTLIRRVSFDLTGLPPTPAEVEAFVADKDPNAWEKVVDRLLTSDRYAERMAIRWLDAARYSDTNGYSQDGNRTMWRWRDWVIDAYRSNMPYDRFTIEQLAGDLLPNPTLSQLIATGFQRNHRTNAEGGIVDEEFRVEYVADRAETTATVWLGLTVGCARCHDHKFDPISQKDYYSFYAFYNKVPERGFVWSYGNNDPVVKAPLPDQQAKLDGMDRRIAELRQSVAALRPVSDRAQRGWERTVARSQTPVDWTVTKDQKLHLTFDDAAAAKVPVESGMVGKAGRFDGKAFVDAGSDGPTKFNYTDPFTLAAWIRPDTANGAILSRGDDFPEGLEHGLYLKDGKLRLHVTFRWTDLAMRLETEEPLKLNEWQHVAVSYDGKMRAAGVSVYVDGQPRKVKVLLDQLMQPMETKQPWRVGAGGGQRFHGLIDDVRVYTRALSPAEVGAVSLTESLNVSAKKKPARRTEAESDRLRLCFLEKFAPPKVQAARAELAAAEEERLKFFDTLPTTMVMKDEDGLRDTYILKRGAYDAHGDKVTAAVPAVLPQLPQDVPANRLSLAKWLVDRKNPLTARATVNRWWAMFFGTGLVKTLEDFGSQGELPLQQDLLDWLAVEFMESGWDVRHMMKTVVMSATYRQSSRVTPELVGRDPENRLLARGPRFRLPAEMIRDNALAVSGLLVDKVGGPSVKPYQPAGLWQELTGGQGYKQDEGEGLHRRSLYTFWRRTVSPPNMVNFDAPTRDTCVVRENRTNTPLQALNLMNDVTYLEAARKLGERMMVEGGATPEAKIARGYSLALARAPKPVEAAALARAYNRFDAYYRTKPEEATAFLAQGTAKPPEKLPKAELAAWTAVASLVLNLDETITKE